MRRPGGRRDAGFTLMEVMLAVVIVAIMGGLVWGSFYQAYRAQEEVRAIDERYHGIRLALGRMSSELSQAFVSDNYDKANHREPLTFFEGEEDAVRFTAFANRRVYVDAKESDQGVFEYRLDDDEEVRGQTNLVRRMKPVVDDRPEDGGFEAALAYGVEDLELEYWDAKAEEWVDGWDTRDSDRQGTLPSRVRITLVIEDGGRERRFSTQTEIHLTRSLAF